MSRLIGILLLLCAGLTFTYAQDWAPYVPGQVSYYYTEGKYEYLFFESIDTGISIRTLEEVAYRQKHTAYFFKYNHFSPPPWSFYSCSAFTLPDSMIFENGTYKYFYHTINGDPDSNLFYFDSPVGTSWTITNPFECQIDFEIVDLRVDTFLGLVDSVKEFKVVHQCQDSGGLLISKRYGFIQGLLPLPGYWYELNPWDEPSYHTPYQQIIGIENDTLSIGPRPPNYLDFIPYTPGTILKWDLHEGGFDPPTYDAYLWDSVLSVRVDSPVTVIDVLRIEKEIGSGASATVSNTSIHIYTGNLQFALSSHSNHYYLGEYIPTSYFDFPLMKTPFIKSYSVHGKKEHTVNFWTSGGGYGFAPDSCGIEVGLIGGRFFRYDTRFGQLAYAQQSYGYDNYSDLLLIGYKSAVDSFGDVSRLPLGTNDIPALYDFSVQPNPASSTITLNLPANVIQRGTLTVQDLTGRTILQEPLHGKATWIIDHLQPGLYLVTVTTETERYQAKLLVH